MEKLKIIYKTYLWIFLIFLNKEIFNIFTSNFVDILYKEIKLII